MKRKVLFFLVVCLIAESVSYGASNAYLRLTGKNQGEIKGSVTQAGREDSIMVISYNHDVISPRDTESGLPTDKRHHMPLRITKEIDRSTPLLMNAWANGEMMTDFSLRFWQATQTGQEIQFYTIILHGAQIASIRQEMLNNRYPENVPHKEREHVTFVYDSIEWIFENGGIKFETDWQYSGADILNADLSGDGVVDWKDLAILANEWLETTR